MKESKSNEFYLKNVLTLAYLGDSVFTLMVRSYLVKHYNNKPKDLNKIANSIVSAVSQAEIMDNLTSLDEDDMDIVIRARNNHFHSRAKHSTLVEYNKATQLEALVGYWYLNDNVDKMNNLFENYVKPRIVGSKL